jgi:hypothetical protein
MSYSLRLEREDDDWLLYFDQGNETFPLGSMCGVDFGGQLRLEVIFARTLDDVVTFVEVETAKKPIMYAFEPGKPRRRAGARRIGR